jgi:hypothetical protein
MPSARTRGRPGRGTTSSRIPCGLTGRPETTGLGEKGLVTERNTVVLFLSRFDNGERTGSGVMRSSDRGTTWIKHRWTAILSAL